MKSILEEYGMLIVVVTVILLFIAFMTPFSEQVSDAITQLVNLFLDKAGTGLTASAGAGA